MKPEQFTHRGALNKKLYEMGYHIPSIERLGGLKLIKYFETFYDVRIRKYYFI